MLPWLFSDDTESANNKGKIALKEKMGRDQECQKLREFLSEDDFYKKLLPGKPRKEAKKAFQRFLNSKVLDPHAKQVGQSFHKEFPECGKMINRRQKPKRESNVYHELYGRQSDIIQAVILKCREASIMSIPVNDELIVPILSGHSVRQWMLEEIYSKTGVKAKVGGIRYELNSSCPCPAGYCPECWENTVASILGSPYPCKHQPPKPSRYPDIHFLEPAEIAI